MDNPDQLTLPSLPPASESLSDEPSRSKTRLQVASLFAGIGGFEKAFESISAKVVAQCESDKFCQSILRKHWPQAKLITDIRKALPSDIPTADVWTAGFPCQDVSLARGNHGRSGLKGNHTSLFFDLMRLVEARKPKVLLLENVVGLLNSHNGCDFAIILTELIEKGYAVSWRVLNARYFGVPQSRPRVFICAWRDDYRSATQVLFEPKISPKREPERHGFMAVSHHPSGAMVPHIAYCVAATSGRHTGNDWSRSYISYRDKVRRPTPTESERLQGFPAGWTMPESTFSAPARGFDSDRYKAVGNAVAVPVAKWIAKRINRLSNCETSISQNDDLPEDVLKLAPDLRVGTQILSFSQFADSIRDGTFTRKWKRGGVACRDMIIEGASSPAPSKIIPAYFVDALDDEVPDDTYFLTSNAATGILRRVDSVGRTLFAPMHAALSEMVQQDDESWIQGSAIKEGSSIGKSSIRSARLVERSGIKRSRRSANGPTLGAD